MAKLLWFLALAFAALLEEGWPRPTMPSLGVILDLYTTDYLPFYRDAVVFLLTTPPAADDVPCILKTSSCVASFLS